MAFTLKHAPRPEWWLPGCGPNCREVRAIARDLLRPLSFLSHDPDAHEQYGREIAASQFGPPGPVETGGLRIDRALLRVWVDGGEVCLTGRELQLLLLLAEMPGRCYTVHEIVSAIWGMTQATTPQFRFNSRREYVRDDGHILRVNVTRVRQKLGRWAHLLETRNGIGYRLRPEPPV